MTRRSLQVLVGVALVVIGGYLAMSPLVVARILGKSHDTTSQLINLRASWGGAVIGVGAFVAWLPALAPRARVWIGLLMWAMAGVGLARTLGFVLDGSPDTRQLIWITAEIAIVAVCATVLVVARARRAR